MRFFDVNGVEGDAILVLLVKLVERGNLPAKRRSCVAAEDQDDRTVAAERAELNIGPVVERRKPEIRRRVAHVHYSGAGTAPQSLKGQRHHQWQRRAGHDPAKCIGRLAHRPVRSGAEGKLGADQDDSGGKEDAAHEL